MQPVGDDVLEFRRQTQVIMNARRYYNRVAQRQPALGNGSFILGVSPVETDA